jgi:large repetitive protein
MARTMRASRRGHRSIGGLTLRATAVAATVALVVGLAEQTAQSSFTAVTGDTGNRVTAAADFCGSTPASVVTASVDTSVAQARDDSTAWNLTSIYVWAKNNDNVRALVSFPLPARPTGCVLTGATLQLYNSVPQTGRVIEVWRLDPATPWTEAGVRWATVPATAGTSAVSTTTAVVGWQSWTVTTQVAAQYANGNNGFLLKDNNEAGVGSTMQTYSSREGTQPPKLTLTWG